MQEGGDIQAHDAAHDGGNGHEYRGERDGEARVPNQRIEGDADGFAAGDDGEHVEGRKEEDRSRARKASGEDGQEREEKRSENFKGEFGESVLQEERFDRVGVVVMFVVEDFKNCQHNWLDSLIVNLPRFSLG